MWTADASIYELIKKKSKKQKKTHTHTQKGKERSLRKYNSIRKWSLLLLLLLLLDAFWLSIDWKKLLWI